MKKKYVCIHGHFYQPPRENPWLETIEIQDSAYPYHDWNERINRECYAPNAASRALDEKGRIKGITNNFERISFNIGPTLLSWLKTKDQITYERIINADKVSAANRNGHGAAIAQAYNHLIMPLASDHDKRTQILWGIADFVHHFSRKPEGMWLPETAVDKKTLRIMRECGIEFTILCQRQARAVRDKQQTQWRRINDQIDPTRSYSVPLSDGESMPIFFYDGRISQAVAFEGILKDGSKFVERLHSGFSNKRDWSQLLNIATDGETFGHHHRFGEMALTYALNHFDSIEGIELTNYSEYLSVNPPVIEADIYDNSSWSCAHGVERWRSDCGCNVGTEGWNQRWRAPLREALDYLKTKLDEVFEREGGKLFDDPWSARDKYIGVVLDRNMALDFLSENGRKTLSHDQMSRAMILMESQRNGMLMYTSCGWFFDDVSGIETVQILRYAARAIQLVTSFQDVDPEPAFVDILSKAKSNIAKQGDAGKLYIAQALKEKATLPQVMANHIILNVVGDNGAIGAGAAFEISESNRVSEEYGDTSLTVSKVKIKSRITLEEESKISATLCLGATDVTCFTRSVGADDCASVFERILSIWKKRELTQLVRNLDSEFDEESFTLKDLFEEGRRKAIGALFVDQIHGFADMYDQLFWRHRKMMDYFVDAKVQPPVEFQMAARYIISKELKKMAARICEPEAAKEFAQLMDEAQKWNVSINLQPIQKELETTLCLKMSEITSGDSITEIILAIQTAKSSGIELDLWKIQNQFASQNGNITNGAVNHRENMKKLGRLLNFVVE